METFIPDEGEVKVESLSSVCDDERRGEEKRRSAPSPVVEPAASPPPAAAVSANVTVPPRGEPIPQEQES